MIGSCNCLISAKCQITVSDYFFGDYLVTGHRVVQLSLIILLINESGRLRSKSCMIRD